jgi:hypothetical protein
MNEDNNVCIEWGNNIIGGRGCAKHIDWNVLTSARANIWAFQGTKQGQLAYRQRTMMDCCLFESQQYGFVSVSQCPYTPHITLVKQTAEHLKYPVLILCPNIFCWHGATKLQRFRLG